MVTASGKVVAIVQARMSSSRLPGKVLRPLAGRPALEWTVRRLQRAVRVDEVVVATSIDGRDDSVAELAADLGVAVARGSLDDVLDRHIDAARLTRAAHIVRVPADKPLVDPATVDRVVLYHLAAGADYSANVAPDHPNLSTRRCPLGFEVEAASVAALEAAGRLATAPHHREHVLPFLYEHPDRFVITRVPMPRATAHHNRWRLNLDTAEDYRLLQQLFLLFDDPDAVSLAEVTDLMDRNPDLGSINSHVHQRSHLSVAGHEGA